MSRAAPVVDTRMRNRRKAVADAGARRRLRRIGSLLAVAGIAAVAVAIVWSPLFAVTEVRVEGVAGERAGEVIDAAAIRAGDNLLRTDLAGATARVRGLPWVADARARRVPPSAVAVRVRPRTPVAVTHVGGAAWLLDADGVVIGGGAPDGLPVITAAEASLPAVGQEATDPAVRNALAVQAALPAPVRALVDRYDADSAAGLRLRLSDHDVWVRFGVATQVEEKARAIELLLAELEGGGRDTGAGDTGPGESGSGDTAEPRVPLEGVELDVRAPNNPVLVPGAPA